MKILYLDFLYPKGHIRQNIEYINCLSEIAEVTVICPTGYFKKNTINAKIIEKDSLKIKNGTISSRLSTLYIMLQSAFLERSIKPDYIFVSSYDTISFAIGRAFFSKCDNMFILQHNNIDMLTNKIKRLLFKSFMKKVKHIVFEDFIRDYLIKTFNIEENSIHVLPHQSNVNLLEEKGNKKFKYKCVGISNSNEDSIISEIIDKEKEQCIFKKMGYKVVLKAKSLNFDNGFLKVINGYLDDDVYNEYINNCECIYMPFPASFHYRMSGTLVDAISNDKIVVSSDIPLIRYYANEYPFVCKIATDAEDLFKFLLNMKPVNTYNKCFEKFKEKHSRSNIIAIMEKMFDRGEKACAKCK